MKTAMVGAAVVCAASALGLAGCGQGAGGGAATGADAKALLASLPGAYQGADLGNGKQHLTLCRSCHTVVKDGADMTGPSLYGVFGRKAGSKAEYGYSDALKAAGFTWDADHLDAWLAKPRDYLPGTKMTFAGLDDVKDRRDLIAYLKVVTSGGPE